MLVYFPQKGGFVLQSPGCSASLGGDLFVTSATNYSHIVLFALFFLISYAHFVRSRPLAWSPLVVSIAMSVALGGVVEALQGASNTGNCELRDLIPNLLGVLIGITLASVGSGTRE